jgi:hypothetical protein
MRMSGRPARLVPGCFTSRDKYQLGVEALIPIKTKTMSTFEAEEHLQVLTPV